MKKNVYILSIVIVLTIITVLATLGQKGYVQMSQLKNELFELEKVNQKLLQENSSLRTEIELLNGNLRYIESLARKDLGLIKEDEFIYHMQKSQ